jgi:Uma2 family endonuclease
LARERLAGAAIAISMAGVAKDSAMATVLPKPWTVDDFLAWEEQQPERYQFVDGMVFMMVGGSAAHTIIKGNVFNALTARLQSKSCRALTEGLKVVTPLNVHYPDVAVTSTPLAPLDDQIREPVVAVEVLSRSTGDRGSKRVGYRELPSLQHYVLVAYDRRRMEVFTAPRTAGRCTSPSRPRAPSLCRRSRSSSIWTRSTPTVAASRLGAPRLASTPTLC